MGDRSNERDINCPSSNYYEIFDLTHNILLDLIPKVIHNRKMTAFLEDKESMLLNEAIRRQKEACEKRGRDKTFRALAEYCNGEAYKLNDQMKKIMSNERNLANALTDMLASERNANFFHHTMKY